MKKFFLVYLFLLVSFSFTKAQSFDNLKNKSTYLNFLPSNQKANDLKPSDIPSKLVLKQMGFSDEEINEAMDYKYSRGKYAKVNQQISDSLTNIDKFNLFFDDTLSVDSIIYPRAKIFGQDIFRNNKLNFYQKALDAKAPENYKLGPGDEISISIWGFNEFSETLEVDSRGYISPSSYGRIYVKGLTFKNLPKRIVSNTKKLKSSPRVFSSLFLISILRKGIFLLLKTFSVAFFCENIIFDKLLFLKNFCEGNISLLFIFWDLFS